MQKQTKRILPKRIMCVVLAFVMLIGLLPLSAMATDLGVDNAKVQRLASAESHLSSTIRELKQADDPAIGAKDTVRAIVVMSESPAALEASAAAASSDEAAADTPVVDEEAEAAVLAQHEDLTDALDKASVDYELQLELTTLINAVSMEVAFEDLDTIAALPGVEAVYLANYYELPDETISMDSSNAMTGLAQAHANGDNGSGTVIAVLDTGITPNHEAFAVYSGMLSDAKLNRIITPYLISGIGYGTYLSQKIPFAYDYADQDDDATDVNGHGTHVAGIAAGYARDGSGEVSFIGSAPDAQILAMKIFSDAGGGTYSDIYFAALEDAYKLGADVVNMSIGSPGGFVHDPELETEVFGNIYQRLSDAGMIICIAAGNESSMAAYSNDIPNYVIGSYTDYGVVGSPSTYDGAVSVASMDNAEYPTKVLQVAGGTDDVVSAAYYDSSDDASFFAAMNGKEYKFVPVPGNGEAADYDDLDVRGKIALIERGSISFVEKVETAAQHGAVAAIVYNNTSGVIYMALDDVSEENWIPAASITQSDAAKIFALYEAGYTAMTFPADDVIIESDTAWLMSDFSSWGCTPSLTLKPTITGIGGNVYSADYTDDSGYTLMSGTSMATPNVTGAMATMVSYLRDQFPRARRTEIAEMAKSMLESSALVSYDEYGYGDYYSPRRQGSGLIDVPAAMALADSAYIVDPICNLFDSQTGTFEIEFTVRNLTNSSLTYDVSYVVQSDYPSDDGYGNYYNSLSALTLYEEDGDYTMLADTSVTVPARGTKTVKLSLQLGPDAIDSLNSVYPNGSFIEGYVFLTEQSSGACIHATYMGYLGDWTAGDILEDSDFCDRAEAEYFLNTTKIDGTDYTYAEYGYTYLDLLAPTTDVNGGYMAAYEGGELDDIYNIAPGENAFDYLPYNEARIAIAGPNGENPMLGINSIYMLPMQLRNARHLIMVVTDAETGEVYYVDDSEYLPKAAYDTEHGYWQGYGSFLYDGTDANGNALPNNTVVDITYYANIPYGEDELGRIDYADLKTQGSEYVEWQFQCTIDDTAPVIEPTVRPLNGSAYSLRISDNQYLAYAAVYLLEDYLYDPNAEPIADKAYAADKPGASADLSFSVDATEEPVYLVAECADYALNTSVYLISVYQQNGVAFKPVYIDVSVEPDGAGYVTTPVEDENEGIVNAVVEDGIDCIAGDEIVLTAVGENFCGWYENGTLIEKNAKLSYTATRDSSLVARFGESYTVTFSYGNGLPDVEVPVADGGTVAKPADPTREGYTFTGWYLNGKLYDFDTPVSGDITLVAQWRRTASVTPPVTPVTPSTVVPPASGSASGETETFPFTDVTTNDWYYGDVKYVWENGLMNGTGSATFAPNESTTRGMIVTILYRLEGKPAASDCPFTDVRSGSYYEDAIAWAAANGIVDGYGSSKFGPDDSITREQLAAILFRYAKFKGCDVSVGESTNILSYVDFDQISSYAIEAIQWAVGSGLIQGSGNKLMPQATATRAQISAVLHRFCKLYSE